MTTISSSPYKYQFSPSFTHLSGLASSIESTHKLGIDYLSVVYHGISSESHFLHEMGAPGVAKFITDPKHRVPVGQRAYFFIFRCKSFEGTFFATLDAKHAPKVLQLIRLYFTITNPLASPSAKAEAYYDLGQCYQNGCGTEKNHRVAITCFTESAGLGLGDPRAEFSLSVFFSEGTDVIPKNPEHALTLLQSAADKGHKEAQRKLGEHFYKEGKATSAFGWFLKAAQQGCDVSEYHVGFCYLTAKGTEIDYAKALKWLLLAAAKNMASAHFLIGTMYANGQGVTASRTTAIEWFKTARALGCLHPWDVYLPSSEESKTPVSTITP